MVTRERLRMPVWAAVQLQARVRGGDLLGYVIARAGAVAHGDATPWIVCDVTVTNRGPSHVVPVAVAVVVMPV